MEGSLILAALLMGLGGSLHCVGMCGPIAIALPLQNLSWTKKIIGSLFYNLGRAFTYALLGALIGLMSSGFSLAGFQQWVSILAGAVMVLSVLAPKLFTFTNNSKFQSRLLGPVKSRLSKQFKKQGLASLFSIGILNGFLPCGLVYMAMAGALASGSFLSAIVFMFVFGLATLPMMLAVNILGSVASLSFRAKINKVIPVVVVLLGMLFIFRGLGLGIPYISPSTNKLEIPINEPKQESPKGSCPHCG